MHEMNACEMHSHVLNKSFSTPVYLSFLSFTIKAILKQIVAKGIKWDFHCSNITGFVLLRACLHIES